MRIFILLFALFAACCRPDAISVPKEPLSEAQRKAAVHIVMFCTDGHTMSAGQGSGTIYADFRIVTAQHVIECKGERAVFVETLEGLRYFARVASEDAKRDIAVLETMQKLPYFRFRVAPTRHAALLCYEAAMPTRARKCGKVSEIRQKPGVEIVHSADTESGNSGSGVFDVRGALVGVVTTRNGNNTAGAASILRKSDLLY